MRRFHRAWNSPNARKLSQATVAFDTSDIYQAWLKAAPPPPILEIGCSTNSIERISVGWEDSTLLWRTCPDRSCTPYSYRCGKAADTRGMHDLSCRRATSRHQRYSMLSDIAWRAIKSAKIPTHKEPTGLGLLNGKQPDGATLIPWSRSQALVWDIIVPDTYAASHRQSTALEAGSAANHAAEMKCAK